MEMTFHLNPLIFDLVKDGNKDVEVRLNDEKRQQLKVGDNLVFLKRPDEVLKITATVTELKYFNNFKEVANFYDMERIYFKDASIDDYIKVMEQFYSKEEQEQYGVVCIVFEK